MTAFDGNEVASPWRALPKRWGHPWHSMCSYLGAFPAALARSFVTSLSDPGDLVLDPFSGRGTTLLEARLTGRVPVASDLNPIAVALSEAKNVEIDPGRVIERIDDLESGFDSVLFGAEAEVQSDHIQLIFHPRVLGQLCYLRRHLLWSDRPVDRFLLGVTLGALHGNERSDGTSSYASISMPNTFSMAPDYVRRYVASNRLSRTHRDLFGILRHRCTRLLRGPMPASSGGTVACVDAKAIHLDPAMVGFQGRIRLVVTSPPYLGVVNYARQNWIRSWFLDEDPEDVSSSLDDDLTLAAWLDFMDATLDAVRAMLRPDGVAVFVIGDVARSSRSVVPLAREFIRRVVHRNEFGYVGCLSDRLPTTEKTTRIWKDTKGRATAIDRVVVISDEVPTFMTDRLDREFGVDMGVAGRVLEASALAEHARVFAGSESASRG